MVQGHKYKQRAAAPDNWRDQAGAKGRELRSQTMPRPNGAIRSIPEKSYLLRRFVSKERFIHRRRAAIVRFRVPRQPSRANPGHITALDDPGCASGPAR